MVAGSREIKMMLVPDVLGSSLGHTGKGAGRPLVTLE
jgi:hypothetical protein